MLDADVDGENGKDNNDNISHALMKEKMTTMMPYMTKMTTMVTRMTNMTTMVTNMTKMATMVTKVTNMTTMMTNVTTMVSGDKDDKGGRTYDEPPTLRPDQATRENLSQSRRRRPPARLSLEKRRFLQLGTEFKLVIYDKYFTSYQTLLIVT